MKILLLYVPLPFFWALQDQQGSRWTFQATRMTGEIGGITIKPDQMQVVNPLLIIIFIPLWDVLVYPLFAKIGIRRPLQKLTVGMMFAGLAFLISAMVELKLETTDPILPNINEGQLRIINGLECAFTFRTDLPITENKFKIDQFSVYENRHIPVNSSKTLFMYSTDTMDCPADITGNFRMTPEKATTYFLTRDDRDSSPGVRVIEYIDSPGKPKKGFPLIRLLVTVQQDREITFKEIDKDIVKVFQSNSTELKTIPTGHYDIYVDGVVIDHIRIYPGAVYNIILTEKSFNNYVSVYSYM